ncbi:MAG: hypothetical protein CM15mP46_1050 [Alphaproteobacteria bacterium]|nr:MAG: hypothetical protein CM15mP46_1050 [Alphaproteobacteria bacterium]
MSDHMTVLVTGGAGYIGSHMVLALLDAGHQPVVLDDFSTGHEQLVPNGVPVFRGNVADAGWWRRFATAMKLMRWHILPRHCGA